MSHNDLDNAAGNRERDLVARDLVMTYDTGRSGSRSTPPALGGVDLTIRAGESVAVMGPSGSGKTTLLHVLAGILRPTGGQVLWRGRDIARMSDRERTVLRRKDFGFVFQQGMLLPELPAIENVALPLMLDGTSRSQAAVRAAVLFAPLGLAGFEKRRPGELSGGQAQRVAIARALVARPGVVFADEPTGALDQTTSEEVMRHLTELTSHTGSSLVVVTHDENVARWCSGVVRVRDGRVVEPSTQATR
jgi:putative ABC transport system ATP-binding protein